jgi:hypothetical protein
MPLPLIEIPNAAPTCCAKPAPPAAPEQASSQRGAVGRTVALLAAGLGMWTAAYVGIKPLSEWLTFRVLGLAP